MSEKENNMQEAVQAVPAAPAAIDKKVKRAKQSCITIFVVAVIALLSFGQPIFNTQQSDTGATFSLNILAAITWFTAVYALCFVVFQWKTLMKVPKVSKVLGIIGSLILFANIACAVLGVFPQNTAPGQIGQSTGPVVWNIDGKDYSIDKTYYIRRDGGNVQYTIDFEYPQAADIHNDNDALAVVFPIMKYACENEKYGKAYSPSDKPQPAFIGVELFTKVGDAKKGYRVALPIEDIKLRQK